MSRKKILILGCAIALAAVFAYAAGNARSTPTAPTVDLPRSAEVARYRANALAFAAANGETRPADANIVGSRREFANVALFGSEVDSDQEVFVVRLHGHFVGYQASVPPGQPLPTGSVLTLVFDANTHGLTDWALQKREVELQRLGTPQPLEVPRP